MVKTQIIVGIIAFSAALLTFAAFSPAMQQSIQVRRVLAATAINGSVICNVTGQLNGMVNASVPYNCSQIETDNDGLGAANSIQTKYFFLNASYATLSQTNTTLTSAGAAPTAASNLNITIVTWVNTTGNITVNATGNATNPTPTNSLNVTVNQVNPAYIVNTTTQYLCLTNATVNSSSSYCYNVTNVTTTFNPANGSAVAPTSVNYTMNSSVQNASTMTNASNGANTTAYVNFTSVCQPPIASAASVCVNTNSTVNVTAIQQQIFCSYVINMTNQTNMTICNAIVISCFSNASNVNNQNPPNPSPFPPSPPAISMMNGTMMPPLAPNMSNQVNNTGNPSNCTVSAPVLFNSSNNTYNNMTTPYAIKNIAKINSRCAIFTARTINATAKSSAICALSATAFVCKRSKINIIIQQSWQNHWCGTCAAAGAKIPALLAARVAACAKSSGTYVRSQKVCNSAYVKFNAAARTQKDICAAM